MTAVDRFIVLGVSLAPYLALAGVDAWLHERARRVPRIEQILHAAAAVLLVAFVIAAFRGLRVEALALFAAFALCSACDELGFHRHLAPAERRVHFMAYAALAWFVGAWWLIGVAA